MTKTDELRQKRSAIEEGGGSESIKEQHNSGKLTARERLAKLFDDGSFVVQSEVRKPDSTSSIFLSRDGFGYSGPFVLSNKF